MSKRFAEALRIYTGIFYKMPAWCELCGAAAFKNLQRIKSGGFYLMCFKKLYRQKRNGIYGINCGWIAADQRNKLPVNAIVFVLEPENIKREGFE